MIDFHSHFLPNMDDGSESIDESLRMLSTSYKMGVHTMVSTSHFYARSDSIDSFLKRRNDRYDSLCKYTANRNDIPNIILGAEVAFFSGMSREKNISELCIENTNYLLLEMPFEHWSSLTINEVKNLMMSCGITPIIAHMERYFPMQRKNGRARELLGSRVFLQTNAEAVINKETRRRTLKMLGSKSIQLLGSDCHNMTDRAPNMDHALKIIKKDLGCGVLDEIEYTGRSILGLKKEVTV